MYLLLRTGIFQCHVSFQGCIHKQKSVRNLRIMDLSPWRQLGTRCDAWTHNPVQGKGPLMGKMLGDIHHGRIIISRVIRWTTCVFFFFLFFCVVSGAAPKRFQRITKRIPSLKNPLFLGPGFLGRLCIGWTLRSGGPLRPPGCGDRHHQDDMKHFFGTWESWSLNLPL